MSLNLTPLLSEAGQALHPIAIRRYQPYLKQPGVVSFAGGWPSAEMFPLELVAELSQQVILEEGSTALQYGATQGFDPLLAQIMNRMDAVFGVQVGQEQLCITAGAQQGIYLAALTLVSPGDVVAVEAPTFSGGISVFHGVRAEILPIPMDEEGLQTAVLEEHLRAGVRLKMVYTIPDFQNPTGRTMSAGRRRDLVRLAREFDFIILEDAPYSELRFEGEPLPPIIALDQTDPEAGGRVIYLGSFSKVFSPLRLGWVAAAPNLIQKMVVAKQGIDLCCPTLTQAILARFIAGGHQERHLEKLRDYYRHKRDVMLAGLDRHMPAAADWTSPEGGMFVWATLPEGVDTDRLFFDAVAAKVAFVPGSAFFPDERPCSALRLNFVTASAAQIEQGMAVLGRVVAERIG